TLSFLKLRRDFPDMKRPYKMPLPKVWGRLALVGSLFIVVVMLFPGSPGMLVWPLEWLILTALGLLGAWFWIASRRERRLVVETERARLVLGEYV
ncbi:hypothetical protein MJD09_15815, partial [bacterium]|nr:hypothetical protein [bacterium]